MIAIENYIAHDNPFAAISVIDTIEEQIKLLKQHPKAGRHGRLDGTRELVISGLPYVVVYREHQVDTVEIVRVLHGAQQWPPVG